jgi:hypothetical protein
MMDTSMPGCTTQSHLVCKAALPAEHGQNGSDKRESACQNAGASGDKPLSSTCPTDDVFTVALVSTSLMSSHEWLFTTTRDIMVLLILAGAL